MAHATPGEADLFAENFDSAVKNIALAKTVIRDDVTLISSSQAAEEHFYRETAGDLVDNTQIPRNADFAADQLAWEKVTIRPRKYGIESRLAWEDTIVNAVDVPARTTMRIGNIVARAIDERAWDVITESQSASAIDSLAVAATWDNATR